MLVLVMQHDQGIGFSLGSYLMAAGHTVYRMDPGSARAMVTIDSTRPELVLLAYNLYNPAETEQLAAEVKKRGATLILTTVGATEGLKEVYKADAVVYAPFSLDLLDKLVGGPKPPA